MRHVREHLPGLTRRCSATRVAEPSKVRPTNSAPTIAVTGPAGAARVIGGLAGAVIGRHAEEGAPGVVEPSPTVSDRLRSAQAARG